MPDIDPMCPWAIGQQTRMLKGEDVYPAASLHRWSLTDWSTNSQVRVPGGYFSDPVALQPRKVRRFASIHLVFAPTTSHPRVAADSLAPSGKDTATTKPFNHGLSIQDPNDQVNEVRCASNDFRQDDDVESTSVCYTWSAKIKPWTS